MLNNLIHINRYLSGKLNAIDKSLITNYWNVNYFNDDIVKTSNWYTEEERLQYKKEGNKRYTEDDVVYEITNVDFRTTSNKKKVTANNIVACFGCSNTFGIGLPWNETWVAQLDSLLDSDHIVKNYGLSGASNARIARNIYNYLQFFKPKAICCFFPEVTRMEYYSNGDYRYFLPNAKGKEVDNADYVSYSQLATPENGIYDFVKNFKFIEILCQVHNVKLFWWTWSPIILNLDTDIIKQYLKYDNFLTGIIKDVPEAFSLRQARDNAHFGYEMNNRIANGFYNKLKHEKIIK